METKQSSILGNEHLYGQAFYPTVPFSWLAPLWSFLCGVIASAAWTWTRDNLLRLILGLLLAGPLLGTVWMAGAHIGQQAGARDCLCSKPKPVFVLPYTTASSISYRFATRLSVLAAWWQQVKAVLSKTVMQWIASIVFALALAAQLGQRSLIIAVAELVLAHIVGFMRERQTLRTLFSISLPLCLAWLLGHVVFAALDPISIVVAVSFALVFYSCSVTSGTGHGLIAQVVPQAIVVVSLIICSQPMIAVAVTLLASSQLLLAPLVKTPGQREQYFRAIQWHLAVSMMLTALALGHKT